MEIVIVNRMILIKIYYLFIKTASHGIAFDLWFFLPCCSLIWSFILFIYLFNRLMFVHNQNGNSMRTFFLFTLVVVCFDLFLSTKAINFNSWNNDSDEVGMGNKLDCTLHYTYIKSITNIVIIIMHILLNIIVSSKDLENCRLFFLYSMKSAKLLLSSR